MNFIQKWINRWYFERWMAELCINCYLPRMLLDIRGLWVLCHHIGMGPWYQIVKKGIEMETIFEHYEYIHRQKMKMNKP